MIAKLGEQEAHDAAVKTAKIAAYNASHKTVLPPAVEGRSATVFVDIGRRFMDHKTEKRRLKAGRSRVALRVKAKAKAVAVAHALA